METLHLIAHPANPPLRVRAVSGRVLSCDAHWCVLRWKVEGAGDLVVPRFAGQGRQDGLWQTTCFELFVASLAPTTFASTTPTTPAHPEPVEGCAPTPAPYPASSPGTDVARILRPAQDERGGGVGTQAPPSDLAYSEFNFSPSERWAAYDFSAYRAGMAQRAMARGPVITPRRGADVLFCDVAIPAPALPPRPWRYGLTAVLEEAGGVKSWWAMAHAGDKPDFHHPTCLGATLAAPGPSPSSPRA